MPSSLQDDQNTINNNYEKYNGQLVTLNEQLPGLLTQYQKDFVTYNKNPVSTNSIQSIFFSDRQNIQNTFNTLFKTISNIQSDITIIDSSTNILNKNLATQKKTYKQYSDQLALYEGKIDIASVMKDDYTTMYFNSYISNLTLFIGICLALIIMFRIFRKSIPSSIGAITANLPISSPVLPK
jgi:hypothetical protein